MWQHWISAQFACLQVQNAILHEIYLGCYAPLWLLGKHSFGCHFAQNQLGGLTLGSFCWSSGAEFHFAWNLLGCYAHFAGLQSAECHLNFFFFFLHAENFWELWKYMLECDKPVLSHVISLASSNSQIWKIWSLVTSLPLNKVWSSNRTFGLA